MMAASHAARVPTPGLFSVRSFSQTPALSMMTNGGVRDLLTGARDPMLTQGLAALVATLGGDTTPRAQTHKAQAARARAPPAPGAAEACAGGPSSPHHRAATVPDVDMAPTQHQHQHPPPAPAAMQRTDSLDAFDSLGLGDLDLGSPSLWFGKPQQDVSSFLRGTAATTPAPAAADATVPTNAADEATQPARGRHVWGPALVPPGPPPAEEGAGTPSPSTSPPPGPFRTGKGNHGHVSKYTAEELDMMRLFGSVEEAREVLRSEKGPYQHAKTALARRGVLTSARKKVLTVLRRRERAAVYTAKKRTNKKNEHQQLWDERDAAVARSQVLELENAQLRAELRRLQPPGNARAQA